MDSFQNKSIIISRKPSKDSEGYGIQIALFGDNNPHLKGQVPFKVLEYNNIEKVRIKRLENISYYTAGNDLVINDLVELNIGLEEGIITLTGKQEF